MRSSANAAWSRSAPRADAGVPWKDGGSSVASLLEYERSHRAFDATVAAGAKATEVCDVVCEGLIRRLVTRR